MKRGALLAVALFLGCGNPDRMNPGDEDMTMVQGMPDLTMQGQPDLKGADLTGGMNDLANPPNLKLETEQPNQRTNGTNDTAQQIAIGDTVDGTIGDPMATNPASPDLDFYKFNAAAGDVLKITMSARGDYQAAAFVRNADRSYDRAATGLGTPDYTRQVYIPTAGQYFLIMTDDRNAQGGATFVGGAAFTYRVSLEKVSVTPSAVTLPVAAQTGMLGADNEVKIFSFTTTAGQGYRAETRALRLTPASNLDTAIYLVDASGTPTVSLAFNDDIDFGGGVYDSKVAAVVTKAATHYVVLDHYFIDGPAKNYEIDIANFDPGQELEGNDTTATANTIAVPSMATPTEVQGAINRVDGGGMQNSDVDNFAFDAPANTYYQIAVTRTGGSTVIPGIAWRDPAGTITFANPNKPLNTDARLEAFAFDPGNYKVIVYDARNTGAVGVPPVGGAAFTYKITISVITRTITPLGPAPIAAGTADKIDLGGKTAWYSFDVPAGGARLSYLDLDLSDAAGVDGAKLNPFMVLYGTDGKTGLAGGNVITLRDTVIDPGSYTLTVSDFDGGFAANNYGFRPRVAVLGEFQPLTDDGTHTMQGTALDASAGGALHAITSTGNLASNAEAWYSLGTLQANGSVSVAISEVSPTMPVDVDLELLRADGTTVVDSGITSMSGALLPATEVYYVHVIGFLASSGPFKLTVNTSTCADLAFSNTNRLLLNEIFARPGASGGDANADGTSSPLNDEFVELMSTINAPIDLSGIIVRDLAGARWRGVCGDQITALRSVVVFGACPGAGCAVGTRATNASPNDPHGGTPAGDRLGLDDGGDTLMLVSKTGQVLDRLSYAASTQNTSAVRGAAGICDVAPAAMMTPAATVQLHNICTAAVGTFSPGLKSDGTMFQPPPAPTNDTCGMATTLVDGVQVNNQDTSMFVNDYDPLTPAGTCTPPLGVTAYPGKDAAYTISIPAGELLTVTITPDTADLGVAIITDCTMVSATCLALKDDGFSGEPEIATYRNMTGSPMTVFIIVDGYTASTQGTFSILAVTAP